MSAKPYQSSATPQARIVITAALTAHVRAMKAEVETRRQRDRALREQYAAGVEVRDLGAILAAAGYAMTDTHIGRIVAGARDAAPAGDEVPDEG